MQKLDERYWLKESRGKKNPKLTDEGRFIKDRFKKEATAKAN